MTTFFPQTQVCMIQTVHKEPSCDIISFIPPIMILTMRILYQDHPELAPIPQEKESETTPRYPNPAFSGDSCSSANLNKKTSFFIHKRNCDIQRAPPSSMLWNCPIRIFCRYCGIDTICETVWERSLCHYALSAGGLFNRLL